MAISVTTAMCDSFKKELLMGQHVFAASGGHTFNLCLLGSAASSSTYTGNAASTNYSEVTGATGGSAEATDTTYVAGGYVAGGKAMATNADPVVATNVAYVDWATDPSWGSAASIISCGAMLYNTNGSSNKAVALFSFTGDKTSSSGTFTVTLPDPGAATAILRLA